jgi:hypothetical protein
MHQDHQVFIEALEAKQRVIFTFASKEDGGEHLVRSCVPMDFGPSNIAKDKSDRYHLWDYDSDSGRHTLSLLPVQVVSIELTEDTFDPGEFITWAPPYNWHHPRDWREFS